MNKDNRIEPTIGTREEQMIALANDPAIDPPMDPNACVCCRGVIITYAIASQKVISFLK